MKITKNVVRAVSEIEARSKSNALVSRLGGSISQVVEVQPGLYIVHISHGA